jgi:ribosomal-protein-alanine N-acetyltransferase
MPARIRPVEEADAAALAELYVRNWEFLRPFEPERPEAFFTVDGQRERARDAIAKAAADRLRRYVILDDGGAVAGSISLENILRGPAQFAGVGYWVARDHNGRGLATAALEALVAEAFGTHGLHRLEAGAITTNLASRRVLEKNRFELIGIAPRYLRVGGAWQDHALYQRLADEPAHASLELHAGRS